jgi:hypothetical protein
MSVTPQRPLLFQAFPLLKRTRAAPASTQGHDSSHVAEKQGYQPR